MKNKITPEDIDALLAKTECKVASVFGKTTVVTAKLPNGFTITESSSCVSPQNYDEKLGRDLAMKKIVDRIWELEGYRLQCELEPKPATDDSNHDVIP